MVQHGVRDKQDQDRPATEKKRKTRSVQRMPSLGIRKVSTKWDHENPFRLSSSLGTELHEEPKGTSHKRPRNSQDGSAEPAHDEEENFATFANVALATALGSEQSCRSDISAPSLDVDDRSHLYQKSAQPLLVRKDVDFKAAAVSAQRAEASWGPVVVARAECELAHPRPSRSSETRLLRVLVTEQEEGKQEAACRKSQKSQEGSQESASSFHTARQGDSV